MPHAMAADNDDAVIFDNDTRPSALLDLTKQDLFAEADLPAIIDGIDFHGGRICTAASKAGCLGNVSVRGDCLPPSSPEPSSEEDAPPPPTPDLNFEDSASTASESLPSTKNTPPMAISPKPRAPRASRQPKPASPSPALTYLEALRPRPTPSSSPSSSLDSFSASPRDPTPAETERHWLNQIAQASRSFDKAEQLIALAARMRGQAVQALQRATEMREVAEFALADCRRAQKGKGVAWGEGETEAFGEGVGKVAEERAAGCEVREMVGAVAEMRRCSRTF